MTRPQVMACIESLRQGGSSEENIRAFAKMHGITMLPDGWEVRKFANGSIGITFPTSDVPFTVTLPKDRAIALATTEHIELILGEVLRLAKE